MSKNIKKTQDMSVEEILKSIRGIINKHEDSPRSNDDEVLELTNIVNPDVKVANSNFYDKDESLISESTFEETSESLKHFAEKAKVATKTIKKSKSLTIDEMVEQMMRPQLKLWLDENLPILVRELVEKEIKRLIPDINEEE